MSCETILLQAALFGSSTCTLVLIKSFDITLNHLRKNLYATEQPTIRIKLDYNLNKSILVRWRIQTMRQGGGGGRWSQKQFVSVFRPQFGLKRRGARNAPPLDPPLHLPVNSFSSDQIVCSLGEPFHTRKPHYFILRMIISLLFEPFLNLLLDHSPIICTQSGPQPDLDMWIPAIWLVQTATKTLIWPRKD